MLSYLSPGITYNGPAIYQRPFDNGAIADWSINGGQNRNNEFLLDGAPNNSIQGGNNIAYVPPVDAVQEFKIVTNSYDAQYGRTAGGVINVSLKSGTNAFHGTVYEFARRKAFDSNEYQFKLRGTPKPDHKLDQYGFQIDGPVVHSRRLRRPEQDVLHVQLRGLPRGDAEPVDLHGARRGAAARRLQQPAQCDRPAHHHLRSAHRPAGRQQLGPRSVPEQRHSRRSHRSDGAASSCSTSCGRTPRRRRAIRGATTSPSRRTSRSTTSTTIATKFDQNLSNKTRMFFRYAYNMRAETRYTNGITTGPAQDGQLPLERTNHTGVARLGPDHGAVGRLQRPRRTQPVPGAGPLRSRSVVQSGRARISAVAHQPAAEQGVPAHQPDGLSGPRARRPQQRDDDRAERAAESHLGARAAQSARRPRHAAHLVHPRDQRQPLRDELRQPLHAARLQPERDGCRAATRSRRSCSAPPAADRSTTTSIRRSAGTTTRRGCRTTGGSPIA